MFALGRIISPLIPKNVKKNLKRKDSDAGETGKSWEEARGAVYNNMQSFTGSKRQQASLWAPTVALTFNFLVSVSIILMNKLVLVNGFNYPIFLTFIHYVCSWLIMALLKAMSILSLSPPPKSIKYSTLFSLGIVMSFSTGLANVSLKYNSVGFYQMAKIAVTPAIVLAEFILFKKRISSKKVLALTVVSVGVAVATVTDLQFHFFGACVAVAWIIPSAVNKILWSNLQQQDNWTAMALMWKTTPITLFFLVMMMPYLDPPGVLSFNWSPYNCATIGGSAILGFLLQWSGALALGFNATDFLVRLRGKRLMLVGDSMNRNQFESLLCMLREGLPDKSKMYEVHGYKITKGRGYYIFKFEDYNCSVEFVRSHFLVREGLRVNGQGNSNPTLSVDRIDKSAPRWKRADILVFNTGHWWVHGKTARGKNYYKEGDHIYPHLDAVEAYRRSMRTWAKWIKQNARDKLAMYRGYSSAHFRGGDWDSGGTCNGEKEPAFRGAILNNYPQKMLLVEEAIREMHVPVVLLNVTHLTNYRKDAHPSVYRKNITAGVKVSTKKQDCSHWCLPGVPDTWNELIYTTLITRKS